MKIDILKILKKIILGVSYIFQIKSNRIFLVSYNGKTFSCNPLYIAKYLIEKFDSEYDIIVAIEKDVKNITEKRNVKIVEKGTLKYYIYYFTSKVLITNDCFPAYLPKKKTQFLINTWHGGGAYKRNLSNSKYFHNFYKIIYKDIDCFISSNRRFSKVMSEDLYVNKEKFFSIGMPRNDMFFSEKIVSENNSKIRNRFNVDDDTQIILYAPTWRDDGRIIDGLQFNEKILETFRRKFNKKVKVFIRSHYHTKNLKYKEPDIIDVSGYSDMQEILCAVDVLITDYSSCMWDFSLMFKPCFIYATDIKEYQQERDFYTPIEKWPFSIAENNEELINNIINFDEIIYIDRVKQHHQDLGSFEIGQATEKICRLIEGVCRRKE